MCLCMYRRRGGELLTTCYYLFILLKLALPNNSFHSFVSFSTFVQCLMRFLLFLLYRFTALYATPLFSFFFFFIFSVAYSHRLRVQKLDYTLHARIFELIHHKLLLEVLIQPGNAGGIHPPPFPFPFPFVLFFFSVLRAFFYKKFALRILLEVFCFVLFCLRKYVIHHTYNMHNKTECYYYYYCYCY
ncbi:T. brucei spp.-specific protein [Trypanosoma brucei gambiense DAL972]|uniref:T. brucei spp.-specific protein n=1 Tax=Trypanosoma brucei gambiense (strain MHOM/CI/86/DAL972) TaxID=679716 RepID=D0A7X0_TRYB9|nr:T. brucei spp.-specific protein [Trypanosoma brucei gambiense DAL972]CBH17771.1 T. brucei spp.-specific protein [Trypanosoma brucei gambiense DAL972]|eukprot:XP_011780035.1 T. brucei spp.-specific protein [Trypanosoma brucei gambiense DAL972]